MLTLLPTVLFLTALLVVIAIVLRRLPAVIVRNEESFKEKAINQPMGVRAKGLVRSTGQGVVRFFRWLSHYAHAAKDYRPKTTYLERMGKAIKLPSIQRFKRLRKNKELKRADWQVAESPLPDQINIEDRPTDPEELHYIDIISKHPNNVSAYEALGKIYLERKKFRDALEVYQFLTKHDSTNGNYFSRLGLVQYSLGDYIEAIIAYEKAVKLEPHKPTRLINLGLSYEAHGDVVKAIGAIEQALVLVPENTQYLGILADLLEKNGQFESVAAVLEKILQIEPTNNAVRDRLMKIRY